jgi:hypothetical protein
MEAKRGTVCKNKEEVKELLGDNLAVVLEETALGFLKFYGDPQNKQTYEGARTLRLNLTGAKVLGRKGAQIFPPI